MNLTDLTKIVKTKSRRLGQGHGSGRGKTGGRGTKGDKARGKSKLGFEGGALPLIKRLPFHRGKDKNKSLKIPTIILNLSDLETLPKDAVVDTETLVKHNIVNAREAAMSSIKILGNGTITMPLTIKLPLSKSARTKVEQAGGQISE
jgi:large subunit ribosomal protein L15